MTFFSLVSLLISLAAVSSYVNYRYIRLPTTVGVMLVALVASLTLVLVGPYAGGLREQAATLVSQIDFNQVVLHGMLAFLLFAGSIQVSLESVAMALSLPANDSRSLVLTLTYFVVVFSILVQGLTVGRVIRMTSGPRATRQSSPGL